MDNILLVVEHLKAAIAFFAVAGAADWRIYD